MGARRITDRMSTTPIEGRRWVLNRALRWAVWGLEDYAIAWDYVVECPEGHTHNLSSFPPGVTAFYRPHEEAREAGCVHDKLYQTGEVSRKRADQCWREIAKAGTSRMSAWRAQVAYWGLRVGGWKAWRDYRRKDKA